MEFSSDLFHYKQKLFTAEASDLQLKYVSSSGITIKSAKTGKKAFFYLAFTKRDKENEVEFWQLEPSPHSVHEFPALRGVKVKILND